MQGAHGFRESVDLVLDAQVLHFFNLDFLWARHFFIVPQNTFRLIHPLMRVQPPPGKMLHAH